MTRPCKNCEIGLHPEDQDLCKKCQQISKLVNEKEALEEENNRYKKELAEAKTYSTESDKILLKLTCAYLSEKREEKAARK